MIAHLSGKLLSKTLSVSVIDCQGVGYEVFHTPWTAEQMNSHTVSLFIHTHVREDALQLFGFHHEEERSIFKELLKVSGIGPKLAISILSGISYNEFLQAVAQKDLARLQAVQGVGKKTAERIILELSHRLQQFKFPTSLPISHTHTEQELESILMNLGYQKSEIYLALSSLKRKKEGFNQNSLEHLIKLTLGELTQRTL